MYCVDVYGWWHKIFWIEWNHTHMLLSLIALACFNKRNIQSISLCFVFVLDWKTKTRMEKKKLTINRRKISERMKLFLFHCCFELEPCVNFHIKATPIWVVAFKQTKKVSRKKRKYFIKKNIFRDIVFDFGRIIIRPIDDVPISMFLWKDVIIYCRCVPNDT